jgi:nitrate reductase NapAB chaperone NapD
MLMFTARYKGHVSSILVHKEMQVPEFLDALSYSLNLPEGHIVGFQDRNGKLIMKITL